MQCIAAKEAGSEQRQMQGKEVKKKGKREGRDRERKREGKKRRRKNV